MSWQKTRTEAPRWIAGIEPAKELLAATGTQILEIECREQPERLRQLLRTYAGDPAIQASSSRSSAIWLHEEGPCPLYRHGRFLLFFHQRIGAAAVARARRHSRSMPENGCITASSVWDDAALSILLTTSGESAELVELFKRGGNRALGLICNNPASTCWNLAENKLPILAGPEYGNATKTYTNATAAAIILASEIVGRPWQQEAERAAEVFSAHLGPIFAMRGDLEKFCRGAANTEIIGRGAAYGGAFMSALCIREMTGHRAAPHTGAGFKHGPNLDVDASHVAIIFALGRAAELGIKLAQECNRRGGKVVLVSSEEHKRHGQIVPGQDRGSSGALGGHHVPAGPAGAHAGDG